MPPTFDRSLLKPLLPAIGLALSFASPLAVAQASAQPADSVLLRALVAAASNRAASAPPASTPSKETLERRFQVVGNELYDRKADLTWQRCDYGQTWDEGNAWCKGSIKHMTVGAFADDVKANAPGWRLPELGEVMGLLEVACIVSNPAVREFFPETARSTYYLTSTPHSNSASNMTAQCFGTQVTSAGLSRGYVSIVRLVHSGPPAASLR
ncbi:MAG TPA: DUF1566 domain-containing protein, partial [Chloroflexota bacterium]|jgi:hypothetical protein|nr:DUF1566 domain-containing protein [Chloroflexota bacterium]